MGSLLNLKWPEHPEDQIKELRNIFLIGSIIMCPIILILLYRQGIELVDFTPILIVVLLGSLLAITLANNRAITPFRKNLFTPHPLSELTDENLKVLSFLSSGMAKIILSVSGIICSLSFIFVMLTGRFLNKVQLAIGGGIDFKVLLECFFTSFLYVAALFSIQETILYFWLSKNYARIISSYSPWPRDRKFPNVPFEAEKPKKKTKLDKIYDILYIIFAFLVWLLYLKYRGKI